jgi:hypothetical protein
MPMTGVPGLDQLLDLSDDGWEVGRVTRAIRDQDAPRSRGEDVVGGGRPVVNTRRNATPFERAQDVPLGAAVDDRDIAVAMNGQDRADAADQVELRDRRCGSRGVAQIVKIGWRETAGRRLAEHTPLGTRLAQSTHQSAGIDPEPGRPLRK